MCFSYLPRPLNEDEPPLQFQLNVSPSISAPAEISLKWQPRKAMRCDALLALAALAPRWRNLRPSNQISTMQHSQIIPECV